MNAAARVVAYLADMAARKAAEGPFDEDFDVPYTTVHTGTIAGGTQLNIVPGHCRFEFEFRYLPGDDPEALLAEVQAYAERELAPAMQTVDPASGFTWEPMSSFPGLDLAPGAEVVEHFLLAAEQMVAAGNLEQQAVAAVDRDDGAVAGAPVGKARKRRRFRSRIRSHRGKPLYKGSCMRQRHPRLYPAGPRRRICRRHDQTPVCRLDGDQPRLAPIPTRPAQPVRRQERQE